MDATAKIVRTSLEYLIGWGLILAVILVPCYLMSGNGPHIKQPKTAAEWAAAHPVEARKMEMSLELRGERLAVCYSLDNPDLVATCLR